MIVSFIFWACPYGSGYPFQVLALPPSGCGLSSPIPHATGKQEFLILITKEPLMILSFQERENDKTRKILNQKSLIENLKSSLRNKTGSRQIRFIKQIRLNCISPCKSHFCRIRYFFTRYDYLIVFY